MSANKYSEHLVVIPEDDANRQILNGFRNHLSVNSRRIQVDPVAGGWRKVLETFTSEHVPTMGKFPKRHLLLLIDFDNNPDRIDEVKEIIPDELSARVFVLGVLSEPENLSKSVQKTEEKIGEILADDCLRKLEGLWGHSLMTHNDNELKRMQSLICGHLMES